MYLKDPKTNEPSVTLTVFVYGMAVCLLKLLASGVVVGTLTLGVFGGGEFAAACAALGAVYVMRRSMGDKE